MERSDRDKFVWTGEDAVISYVPPGVKVPESAQPAVRERADVVEGRGTVFDEAGLPLCGWELGDGYDGAMLDPLIEAEIVQSVADRHMDEGGLRMPPDAPEPPDAEDVFWQEVENELQAARDDDDAATPVQEGRFTAALHPKDRRGRWMETPDRPRVPRSLYKWKRSTDAGVAVHTSDDGRFDISRVTGMGYAVHDKQDSENVRMFKRLGDAKAYAEDTGPDAENRLKPLGFEHDGAQYVSTDGYAIIRAKGDGWRMREPGGYVDSWPTLDDAIDKVRRDRTAKAVADGTDPQQAAAAKVDAELKRREGRPPGLRAVDDPKPKGKQTKLKPVEYSPEVAAINSPQDAEKYLHDKFNIEADLTPRPPQGKPDPGDWPNAEDQPTPKEIEADIDFYRQIAQAVTNAAEYSPELTDPKNPHRLTSVSLWSNVPHSDRDPDLAKMMPKGVWGITGPDPRKAAETGAQVGAEYGRRLKMDPGDAGAGDVGGFPDADAREAARNAEIFGREMESQSRAMNADAPGPLAIFINDESNPKVLRRNDDVADGSPNGSAVADADPFGRMTHELGHAVAAAATWDTNFREPSFDTPAAARRVREQSYIDMMDVMNQNDLDIGTMREISGYGSSAPTEALAEVYATLHVPGALDTLTEEQRKIVNDVREDANARARKNGKGPVL